MPRWCCSRRSCTTCSSGPSRSSEAQAERRGLLRALQDVVEGPAATPVLQPIVDLTTGRAVAAEGLTRFSAPHPGAAGRRPALGRRTGSTTPPGSACARTSSWSRPRSVLDLLDDVPAEVALAINLGPETLLTAPARRAARRTGRCRGSSWRSPSTRRCTTTTRSRRRCGPTGSGAAPGDRRRGRRLREPAARPRDAARPHQDRHGADPRRRPDVARRTLLAALAGFAHVTGCRLVAEGVETVGELQAVAAVRHRPRAGLRPGRAEHEPGLERLRRALRAVRSGAPPEAARRRRASVKMVR